MAERILVVDDDLDTLRLVGLMLQRQGYQILAASSGTQAITIAQSEKPDLILLDVMMPDVDGYEVTRRLRNNPATGSIPIIMFTAKTLVDDKVLGFESGVDDYITKPTQPRELFAHVKAVLARSGKVPAAAAQPTPPRERGYVVGVMAAKGGLGVSTLAINLGVSLQQRTRQQIIVAELRPGEGSLSLDLGYANPDGMNRLLQGAAADITSKDIESALITHKSEVRLLLASYSPTDARYMQSCAHFESIARILSYLANFIILDLGPGINPIADKVLPTCDEIIIVMEPIPNSLTRTHLLTNELTNRGFGANRVSTVLYNRQRTEMQYSLAQVQKEYSHPIALVFTAAPELTYQAAKANQPLVIQHPDNLTSQQFAKLAENITKHVRIKENQ